MSLSSDDGRLERAGLARRRRRLRRRHGREEVAREEVVLLAVEVAAVLARALADARGELGVGDLAVVREVVERAERLCLFRGRGDAAAREGRGELGGREEARAVLVDREERLCLLYTSPSPRDGLLSRMPSSA